MAKAIAANLAEIRQEIAEACARVDRHPEEVRILAATKGRTVAEIRAAIEAGIDLIGENTVQEALSKFEFLPPVEKHFIGHLQRNKAKAAVRLFDGIESVDSVGLAEELDRQAARGREARGPLPILLQVNPVPTEARHGFKPKALRAALERIAALPHLRVRGLMAMLPYEAPERLRPYFREVKALFEEAKTWGLPIAMEVLSMGISHDFVVAVEEGSTLVRLGTRLFGGPR